MKSGLPLTDITEFPPGNLYNDTDTANSHGAGAQQPEEHGCELQRILLCRLRFEVPACNTRQNLMWLLGKTANTLAQHSACFDTDKLSVGQSKAALPNLDTCELLKRGTEGAHADIHLVMDPGLAEVHGFVRMK